MSILCTLTLGIWCAQNFQHIHKHILKAAQMWNAGGLKLHSQKELFCSTALYPGVCHTWVILQYIIERRGGKGTILLQHLEKRNNRKSVLNIDLFLAAWLHSASSMHYTVVKHGTLFFLCSESFTLYTVFLSCRVNQTYAENLNKTSINISSIKTLQFCGIRKALLSDVVLNVTRHCYYIRRIRSVFKWQLGFLQALTVLFVSSDWCRVPTWSW